MAKQLKKSVLIYGICVFLLQDYLSAAEIIIPPIPIKILEIPGCICGESDTKICYDTFGKLQMPEGSQDLALDYFRPIAMVAAGETGLLLIDASDPDDPKYFNNPVHPFSSEATGFVNSVVPATEGSYCALIASNKTDLKSGAFEIVNITNPPFPQLVGSVSGSYRKLAVSDDGMWAFSYNEDNATIDIIDISDFLSPKVANTAFDIGEVSDLSYTNDFLQVLRSDGSSTFYFFDASTPSTSLPELIWWISDYSPCEATEQDFQCQTIISADYFSVVRDGGFHLLAFTPNGPMETGIFKCTDLRHNCGAYTSDGDLIVDLIKPGEIRGPGGQPVDCEFSLLVFFRIPESDPLIPVEVAQIMLPNEIKGIAVRDGKIYVADHANTFNCKTEQEDIHFRIYAVPKRIVAYNNMAPTIDAIDGIQVYKESELPRMTDGGNFISCVSHEACGPRGYCSGGVCVQPPVIEVGDDQTIVLEGINYWDTDALVLIQNVGSSSSISHDAIVFGDSDCDSADWMSVKLNPNVAGSGLKKIKIRNPNNGPKVRTCVNCADLNDPECIPDYVDSREVIVYFHNKVDASDLIDILFLIDHTQRVRDNGSAPGSGYYFPQLLATLSNWVSETYQPGTLLDPEPPVRFAVMVYDAVIDARADFEDGIDAVINTINGIWTLHGAAGWENMDDAMETAQSVIGESDRGGKIIVLISDGRISGSSPSITDDDQIDRMLEVLLPSASENGIKYCTYGFPSYRYTFYYNGNPNYDLMEDIANRTEGLYRRGNDTNDLRNFLNKVLAEEGP
jgi:hypothetical protein